MNAQSQTNYSSQPILRSSLSTLLLADIAAMTASGARVKCGGNTAKLDTLPCKTLHLASKVLLKRLHRLAGKFSKENQLCILSNELYQLIQGSLEWCSNHSCLNLQVPVVYREISYIMLFLCETNNFMSDKEYGMMHFLINSTHKSLTIRLNILKHSFQGRRRLVNEEDYNRAQSIIEGAEEILSQSKRVWYDKEGGVYNELQSCLNNTDKMIMLNASLNESYVNHMNNQVVIASQNTRIIHDLYKLLGDAWIMKGLVPLIKPFGSRISMLGGLDSDLDISLSLYKVLPDNSRVLMPILIDNKRNKRDALLDKNMLTTSEILKDIQKLTKFNRSNTFLYEIMIPWARVPIIKLIHRVSNVEVNCLYPNAMLVSLSGMILCYRLIYALEMNWDCRTQCS
jgi:hypothetical protein